MLKNEKSKSAATATSNSLVSPRAVSSTVPRSAVRRPPGGSRKGRPNKHTTDVKEMILGALEEVGGQAYLAKQAEANPVAFLALLGRTLPKDMTLKSDTGADMAAAVDLFVAKLFAPPEQVR